MLIGNQIFVWSGCLILHKEYEISLKGEGLHCSIFCVDLLKLYNRKKVMVNEQQHCFEISTNYNRNDPKLKQINIVKITKYCKM